MTKSLSKDVARVIRGILAERQMTVQQFAARMGEPNSSVARWVNGSGTFKTDKLDAMADALDMDTAELVLRAVAKRGTTPAEQEDLRRAIDRVRPPQRPTPGRSEQTG